jgi:DNA-binding CsgD family transcriptional regulator
MTKYRINIALYEPSSIIYEGLATILLKSDKHFNLFRINHLDEVTDALDMVILNPTLLQNRISDFRKVRKNGMDLLWVGLLYSFFDTELLSCFDDTLSIYENPETICEKLAALVQKSSANPPAQHEQLSDREIDVLIQLVKGLSNKEIADALHISTHTVISHRKNITQKTGIKSQSGLTIYAISKKIVAL